MANLKYEEIKALENLLNNGGYVLDFEKNRDFSAFFRDYDIDIYCQEYSYNGDSKMKRLRAFWESAPNDVVGQVLEGLLTYAENNQLIPTESDRQVHQAQKTIARLLGREVNLSADKHVPYRQEFSPIDLTKLNLHGQLESVVQQRISEINKIIETDAPLSIIFLCGSTLEGLLLNVASQNSPQFMGASKAPSNLKIENWSISQLIKVAHELGIILEDAKEFSSSLWEFRNYIHPLRQATKKFSPQKRTADMGWKALQAVIEDLSKLKNGKLD